MKMKHKGSIWISTGLLLIAAALLLVLYNMRQSNEAGQTAQRVLTLLSENLKTEESVRASESTEELPDYVRNPDMEMPVSTVNGIDYIGVLEIPVLELELPIISDWSYTKLRTAPCRYQGSAYKNDLILMAHNYVSHFGNLKNLRQGDLVRFTDEGGNVFSYTVVELETLMPMDVEEMESGDWDLTLFTCTVGGRSRVTVRCEAVS